MNSARMLFAVGLVVLCVAGCSDSENAAKPKEAVAAEPMEPVKLAEQDFLSVKRQAEAGDASAQYELGLRYAEGKGVPKDVTQAVAWYRKAAEQGNAKAQYKVGMSHFANQNPEQGVEWIRKSAEKGDASAAFVMSLLYAKDKAFVSFDGRDFSLPIIAGDEVQALAWTRKAAERGNANA